MTRVLRTVWQDEWLVELGATNWIGWSDLRRVAAELRLRQGDTLVDLACGSGGVGLWVAQQGGSSLIGVDNSPAGCAAARQRAQRTHLEASAQFIEGDMAQTTLMPASADALMSIDALQITPRRAEVCVEIARLLRPGGRVAVTTWDHPGAVTPEELMPNREVVPDTRPLLEAAGIRVLRYEQLESRHRYALLAYRAILADRDSVAAVVGPWLVAEAEWGVAHGARSRHVLIVGERVVG